MLRMVKFISLILVSLVLVFGTGIEADAKKKKKKKIVLTEAENAMFDKWEVKPKKTAKSGQGYEKKTKICWGCEM